MKHFLLGSLLFLFGASSLPGDERGPSLSESVDPLLLPLLKKDIHEHLKLPDLSEFRGRALRLVRLNERHTCYSFSLTKVDGEKYSLEWNVYSGRKGELVTRVEKKCEIEPGSAIESAMAGEYLKGFPVATRPVLVGSPYMFVLEIVGDGDYSVFYRDGIRELVEERKMGRFVKIVEELTSLCDLSPKDRELLDLVEEEDEKEGH